ncbi:PadR family transcriptional regulator [Nocardia jejuensis]|uniref:PadR family transcriptional regulator n=1 Tax=Nocardia jejuensis TaxID=328049 RepID=UPI000B22C0A3|nr:PadR family transcriptional regulator [Nocardia jejuensis]
MSLRYALLGLLSDRPASGYDLLRRFRDALANVWPATQSQIYTELTKLADSGSIAVTDEGPRGRKEYTITEAGLADLRTWLTTTEPKRNTRNEMLLRVFFLGAMPPEHARDYLTGIGERTAKDQGELAALKSSIDWDESDLSTYGRIAMEWGERYHAMNQEWARWALAQLPERGEQPGDAGSA